MYNHIYMMSQKGFDTYMQSLDRGMSPMPWADLAFYVDDKNVVHIIKNKQSIDDAVNYITRLGYFYIVGK
jgi:hypothetical protein